MQDLRVRPALLVEDVTVANQHHAAGGFLLFVGGARVLQRLGEALNREWVRRRRFELVNRPEGADLIPNRMSGAPGIRLGNVILMAGVPHITAGMLDALTGELEGGAPERSAAYTPKACTYLPLRK